MRQGSDKIQLLVLLFLTAATAIANGQDTERPLPPVLDLVSVNPLNGNTTLSWSPGGSPDVAGYVFYVYRDGAGEAFDTIYIPGATSYTDTRAIANLFSVTYIVAAIDSADNISPLSNMLRTIFTTSDLDSCNNGIKVTWTSYSEENNTVDYYDVKFSINGGSFSSAGTIEGDTTLFIEPVITGSDYCFFIEASINGNMVSRSNRVCTRTDLEKPPAWINGDYATVSGRQLLLSFSYDTDSEIETFRIEQSENPVSGFAPVINVTSVSGIIEHSISPVPTGNNYYRLSAINSCGQAVVTSNPVTLMNCYLSENSNSVLLEWTRYLDWRGGVDSYSVYRSHNGNFEEVAILPGVDTSWADDPYSFIYETTGDSVCYYIIASEGNNTYYQDAGSKSTTVCMEAPWRVFVPNGFTPDGDGINDLFRPVLSFTPSSYRLIIKTRAGTTLFESQDPLQAWDGISRGDRLQQDAYIWFLEVITPGGKTITRQGVVTIIFN